MSTQFTRLLSLADFTDALTSLDDGIVVETDQDDSTLLRIVATLSQRHAYAQVATDWRRRILTPRFLAEISFQLGEIAERAEACKDQHFSLPRGWYRIRVAEPITDDAQHFAAV